MKGKHIKVNPLIKKKVIQRHLEGVSRPDIARMFSLHPSTVSTIIIEHIKGHATVQ